MSTKVISIDLAGAPEPLSELGHYDQILVLVRWRARPLGRFTVPVVQGEVSNMWRDACLEFSHQICKLDLEEKMGLVPTGTSSANLPSCSVVIATHERTDDLSRCLDSVCSGAGHATEIIVVDNAPATNNTAEVVGRYPVRYLREDRQGASWARYHGARNARAEVVAFIDDDVIVDPYWLDNILQPFSRPEVSAVTGLVMPLELETKAQEQFEQFNGFCFRGFSPRDFTANVIAPINAGIVGASACMAVRRDVVNVLNLFALEMGPGTVTRSGEDTYVLYRLLSLGHRIVYNPEAIVWHRHRRTHQELKRWLYGYSVGAFVFYIRCLLEHGEVLAIYYSMKWLKHHHIRQLWRGIMRRQDAQPLSLTMSEIAGVLASPRCYWASKRKERMLSNL